MNSTMKEVKEQALCVATKFIAKLEGCELTAYPDPYHGEKIPTIGFGRTLNLDGTRVKMGDVSTLEVETEHLKKLVTRLIDQIVGSLTLNTISFTKYAQVEWTRPRLIIGPNQLAAIAALAYNIGINAWIGSSVRRDIMAMRLENIRPSWMMWNKSNGQVSKGLINRREQEYNYFLKGVIVAPRPPLNIRVRS